MRHRSLPLRRSPQAGPAIQGDTRGEIQGDTGPLIQGDTGGYGGIGPDPGGQRPLSPRAQAIEASPVIQGLRQALVEQLARVAQAQVRSRVRGWHHEDQARELEAWRELETLVQTFRAALDQVQAPAPA